MKESNPSEMCLRQSLNAFVVLRMALAMCDIGCWATDMDKRNGLAYLTKKYLILRQVMQS